MAGTTQKARALLEPPQQRKGERGTRRAMPCAAEAAAPMRLPFGSDSWYSFSFKVEGQPPLTGSQRWIIAAWKQEAEGGPFLAQRFDEGVFHITLESGARRVLLASTKGEVRSFAERLQSGLLAPFTFVSDPEREDRSCHEYGETGAARPSKNWVDMVFLQGGLDGNGLVEIYANGVHRPRWGTIGAGPGCHAAISEARHNRAPMPGTSTVYFDRIRRGTSQPMSAVKL
jgi:hypothetical protein